ncbi:Glutaredoxin [Artemisia annua]|uniref:Glutaredoxin n=1 Tax=Artemisia annua TaxID=35608 RepID=A0A2U1QCN8_ARTAN|nr:Glutaredoxin [Artemisia annua]
MGCTPSKQPVCRNCNAQYSPVRQSYSSYSYHSPPRDSDLSHVVSLNSSTLGYLLLDPTKPNVPEKSLKDVAVEMIETKTWSKMIDKKIAKRVQETPVATPACEPETINAWELMEGLDDSSPIQPTSTVDHIHLNPTPLDEPTLPSEENDQHDEVACKPLKIQFVENKSPLCSNSNDAFIPSKSLQNGKNENMPCNKEKLVLYFTSLRGIRKTYEDCCHVRVILKNSGFRVDERDVSMHSGFKEELKELLGDQYNGELPKVFIGKKYIGGVDEIRRFHDELMLDKVFEGCEMAIGHNEGCEGCGDVRFVLCETCSGSCKIYYEVNSDEGEKEEIDESDYGFQRCPDCNENGLVRCPICCD